MLGCYDFIGHYDWSFEWFRKKGGEALAKRYWVEAIPQSQPHNIAALIQTEGFEGMNKHWGGGRLNEEGGTFFTRGEDHFRMDVHECATLGFLKRNKLKFYHDYCHHCAEWVNPVVESAGFILYAEHDHQGHCFFEFRRKDDSAPPLPPEQMGARDVRNMPDWNRDAIHRFVKTRETGQD